MMKKGLGCDLGWSFKLTTILLVGTALIGACSPAPSPTPTLSPILIQAFMTQQAKLAAPTVGLPYAIISTPSPTTKSDHPISNYQQAQVVSETPDPSRTPSQASVPTITPVPYNLPTQFPLPEEHFIIMSGHHQYFAIGCETSAAVDWADYFGVQINEFDFQYRLPRSDNPDYGFVGDVNSNWGQTPPYAYGVYPGPVVSLLKAYGVPAVAVKNGTMDMVKNQLARDNPVIVWVIGNMVGGIPANYKDKQGRLTVVAAYEHVVILTGYNEKIQHIRYLNNGHFYEAPYATFLNSWGVLGSMAVTRD